MIEINPLTPSYPIKKLDKIIQDQQQRSKHNESSNSKKEDEEESTKEPNGQHIDEIV
jgi:hypothetical protein